MNKILKINRSLISVSDKRNIVSFAKQLKYFNIDIISTGNTYKELKKNKISVRKVNDITHFPEILDGRVKTLHPNIFGGILANSEDKNHLKQIKKLDIKQIELLVVNLYPFEKTIKTSSSIKRCIENIDIGGPSLIRAAAKNFSSTTIVSDIIDYKKIINDIKNFGGITIELRKSLAMKAFKMTMLYDTAIFEWFQRNVENKKEKKFLLSGNKIDDLRYGENPHQNASIYCTIKNNKEKFYNQLQGKELSFNNLNDLKTGLALLSEFSKPTSVIIKHAIPCGVAEDKNINNAWHKSLYADELSAFGGVVALNRNVDKKLAIDMSKIFLEVIAAKSFSKEALEIFKRKKNLRLLKVLNLDNFKKNRPKAIITLPGLFLVQDSDDARIRKKDLKVVSLKKPKKVELEDLIFANKIVKHVRSNAIVIAKNKVTLGIGSGNTSRIDSVDFAILKSTRANKKNRKNFLLGSVMASDAFFPFSDSIINAYKAGVRSVIQPGGSLKDKVVIKEVDKKKISMVFTNRRSFSH
tara:strand:- start:1701 stop:3272 length:1572 start_codon:yes stop_codon:yes gene_type:complete